MRCLVVGGGTGGHVFPAIAVAEELLKRGGVDLTYVGSEDGLEARLIPERGWNFLKTDVKKWKGEGKAKKLKTILMMPKALIDARRILKKVRPDVVVGVGGYISGPVVLMAALTRLPTVIMEQNSIPGYTNRILGHFVKKICLTFSESAKYFDKDKALVTGNPVRSEVIQKSKAVKEKGENFVLFCFGGSQGAKALNESMIKALPHLSEFKDKLYIIHQVGRFLDLSEVKAAYRSHGFEAEVYSFIDKMADFYPRVDLVVSRAGATSVSELMVMGKPAILVPYPYAADNHQEFNARSLADGGGVVMILNRDLTGELLAKNIKGLIRDRSRLEEMSKNMRRMARPNAAADIVDQVFMMAG